MPHSILPIVGGYYRPPAALVLASLPIGAPLFLCAEPDNAVDPNAVAVWILSETIPASAHANLEARLPDFGFTLDSFLAVEQWHLGYIPKDFAARLKAEGVVGNYDTIVGAFAILNAGKGDEPAFHFPYEVL
jgi:hypothetical protein